MKRLRLRLIAYLSLAFAALLFLFVSQSSLIYSRGTPSAQSQLLDAWQRAQEIGIYDYQTDILQTTWPTPRLENVGLSSQQERIYLEGSTNRHTDFMQMTLWSESGSVASRQNAIEIKVEDGKALGRVGDSDWQETDDKLTNLFAPGNDALGYLVAAKDVREVGRETRGGVSFMRYEFELDGLRFAQYMRGQMEEELRRKGKLPAGLSVDLADHYVQMTGTGELWLNDAGLPVRQVLQMTFPPEQGAMESYEAQITTDFSNWGEVEQAFFGLPRLLSEHDWQHTGSSLGLIAALMGLTTLMVLHRDNKRLYGAFVTAVIVSMVLSPLMQSHQVYAFAEQQQATVSDYQQAQEEQQAIEEAETALIEKDFDPSVNPLSHQLTNPLSHQPTNPYLSSEVGLTHQLTNPPTHQLTNALTNQTDTDGDGLSDDKEMLIGTNKALADTDGDGLSDGIEVNELGTSPKQKDTDGDLISDQREVQGFTDGNRHWYLNPLDPDTNGDSRADLMECSQLIDIQLSDNTPVTPSGTACEDTDGDTVPDVFDYDDDNDQVPDALDSAPTTVMAGSWDAHNSKYTGVLSQTVNLQLNGFTANKPLLVDLELRPTDPNHLWYTQNVLDWPSNDKEGQVRRVHDTTFGASGRDANGDMRLIPMVELEIPYRNGHYGNLPVKAGYTGGITPTTPLANWLDKAKTDSYSMAVRKKDNTGTLLVYVPLTLLREQQGDQPVAFAGRIYYEPNSTDFGPAQKMRLVWAIRAKVDVCNAPAGTDYETHCKNNSNWVTQEEVIHTYVDDWYLTGLTAREEHGIDVGVVFENASYGSGSAHYENYLWQVADGLQKTFLKGRTGSNSQRDMTVTEIKRRFDHDTNGSLSNSERWNIPAQALDVETYSFLEEGATAAIPMTYTKQILSTHFPSASQNDIVNLLFVREEKRRLTLLELASATKTNGLLTTLPTIDLSGTAVETQALMSWAPFQKGATAWASYPIETYWSKLNQDFNQVFSTETQLTQAGRNLLAKSFYLSLYNGAISTVQSGTTVQTDGTPDTDATLAAINPNQAALNITNSLLNSLTASYIAQIQKVKDYLDVNTNRAQEEVLNALGALNLSATEGTGTERTNQILSGLAESFIPINSDTPLSADRVTGNATLIVNKIDNALQKGLIQHALPYVMSAGKAGTGSWSLRDVYNTRQEATTKSDINKKQQVYKQAARKAAKSGFITGAGLAGGFFLYDTASNGYTPGSVGFNAALATLIASIIVAVIMAAIALIPVVGVAIVAVITLIDALVVLICQLAGAEGAAADYLCNGITGLMTKLIRFVVYDYNPIADLGVDGRMQPTNFTQTLGMPEIGMSQGNNLTLAANVISYLYMNTPTGLGWLRREQYNNQNLRESAFIYELMSSKRDIHDNISLGETAWTDVHDGNKRYKTQQAVSFVIPFTKAGINVHSTLYLAEGFDTNAQECWFALTTVVCYLRTLESTNHLEIGNQFKYDIFPPTLDGFYARRTTEPYGYSLAWDDRFPTQADFDGDGLRSKAKGGNDPDDSSGDSDGDGLSDFWEVQNGYNASVADQDRDGLSDYWERFYNTKPNQADTDNDGLLDGEEVFHQKLGFNTIWEGGWEIVYAFDASNNPLRTFVTSDPTNPDTDGDGILDKLEKVYGYHPRLKSELNVLALNSSVSNADTSVSLPNLAGANDTLVYTATIQNQLRDRHALGLLEADFEAGVQNDVGVEAATVYNLTPNQQKVLNGQVTTRNDLTTSQEISLTLRAGANIADLRSEAAGRSLWLHLNENSGATSFADSSFLGHHATCSGSSCPTAGVAGYAGQGLQFDGVDDKIVVPDHADLDLTTFSVGAWVNMTQLPSHSQVLVWKDNSYALWLPSYWGGRVTATIRGHCNTWHDTGTDDALVQNRWNYLMMTYDGSTLRLYLNGVLENSLTVSTTPCQNNNPVAIGGDQTFHFTGLMDEVEIYPRALTSQEVQAKFKEPLLIAKFDNNFKDSSVANQTIANPSATNRRPTISSSGGILGGKATFNGKTHLNVTSGGDSLDLSPGDGYFTLAAWLRPTLNDTSRWRGVFGDNSNANTAYPTLEVKGGKVRVGFGTGSRFCAFESLNNVLTLNQWNHLVVTFGPPTLREVEEGRAQQSRLFSLYLNGQQVDNSQLQNRADCTNHKPPAGKKNFNIGRSNREADVYFQSFTSYSCCESSLKLYFDGTFGHNNSGLAVWGSDVDGNSTQIIDKIIKIKDDDEHSFMVCRNIGEWSDTCGGSDELFLGPLYFDNTYFGSHFTWFVASNYYISWNISTHYYRGDIDELRVYNYALDTDEVKDLYDSASRALEMPLDEAPGRTIFQDISGNNLTGTCSGTTCPDSGIPGRSNQALRFDGTDDYVDVTIDVPEDAYALSLWFKTDCATCGIYSVDHGTLGANGHDRDLYLSNGQLCTRVSSNETICTPAGTSYANNQWHHVVHTFGSGNGQRIFVDGVQRATGSKAQSDFISQTGINIGFSNDVSPSYFRGLIDQVTIVKKYLSQSEVQALMLKTPVLNLHLDESLGATTFSDSSNFANNGSCTGNACPQAAVKGKMREGLVFDGENDLITVPDSSSLDLTTFSVGLWVKPAQKKSNLQPLITKESNSGENRNYGLFIIPNTMQVHASFYANCGTGHTGHSVDSIGGLIQNQWNHVMMTYDGQTLALYINGALEKTRSASGTVCQSNHPVKLGNEVSAYTPFKGNMDEVAIYGNALTYREVKALYDYQAAWFDVKEEHLITIDADNPSVFLGLQESHIKLADQVMVITATDQTSNIASVQYRVDSGSWETPTQNGQTWEFTYIPSSAGTKTIEVRATDGVGNTSTSSKSFTVDGTAPTPSLTTGQGLPERSGQGLHLAGSVSDEAGGSGVERVEIELLNHAGEHVSGPILATLSGNLWNVTMPLDFSPTGGYIVRMSAQDKVGNLTISDSSLLSFDNSPPQADITVTGSQTDTISGIAPNLPTIAGTISDIPYPNNPALHLHFEENSGATSFQDGSGNFLHAACTGNACPTAGSGKYGQALSFDGAQDYITLPRHPNFDFAESNFTIALWVKSTGWSGDPAIISNKDWALGSYKGFVLAGQSSGTWKFNLGDGEGSRLDVNGDIINDNQWHHLAVSIEQNGTDQMLATLYQDGVQVGQGSRSLNNINAPYPINIAQDGTGTYGYYFPGLIDDVAIYRRALTGEQIYAMANPTSSAVGMAQINLRHAKEQSLLDVGLQFHTPFEEPSGSTLFRDTSGNDYRATCSTDTCPTAGESGKVNQALRFDDSFLETDFINNLALNRFTMSAWFKTNSSGAQKILSSSNTVHPIEILNGHLRSCVGGTCQEGSTTVSDDNWHLATIVGDTNNVRVYLDGQTTPEIGPFTVSGQMSGLLRIGQESGSSAYSFDGYIDEVRIYNRALTTDEVVALYNNKIRAENPDDQLVLNMPFEEPSGSTLFDDISTNRLTGSCTTCPTAGETGKYGKAVRFDGTDDYLNISSPEALASDSDMTWAAWIKTASDGTLIAKAPATGNWARGGKTFFIRNGSPAFDVGWVGLLQSSTLINDNQWHHVALTVDFDYAGQNDKATLYVDGSQAASRQDWNVNTYNEVNLALKIGYTSDNFPAPSFFNGLIDEIHLYNRVLLPDEIAALHEQTWQAVTLGSTNQGFSTWNYTLPAGIEGPHQIHLRTVDSLGNTRLLPSVWTGEVDTEAPRLTFTRTDVGGGAAQVQCIAQDYNLSETGWSCPAMTAAQATHINQSASWYTSLFSQTIKLARLETPLITVQGAGNSMTACDSFNNCSTTTPTRQRSLNGVGLSVILTPTVSNVFTNIVPIDIAGVVSSPNEVQALKVTIDESTIYTETWAAGTTESQWSTTWTPESEGAYTLEATLTDGTGNQITDTADTMIYVDTTAPQVAITTERITSQNFDQHGYVTVSGLVTETVALQRLQVRWDDNPWQDVTRTEANAWQGTLHSGSPQPPTGQEVLLTARVVDIAGHTTEISNNIFADAAPPAPFTATLSVNGEVITPGMTIDDVAQPELTVTWTASSDLSPPKVGGGDRGGRGLDSYLVEWVDGDTGEVLAAEEVTSPRQASFTAGEAQKLAVRVISRDIYGNETSETIAPIYIDYALTPVYYNENEGGTTYRGWTENACNLIGTDYRIADTSSALASLNQAQNFYTSWDENGLRLAWTGANWQQDGDLFIYFDSKEGGSERAYNPYPATEDNTILILPASAKGGEGEGAMGRSSRRTSARLTYQPELVDQMAADYMLWVQEKDELVTESVTISDTVVTITETKHITATLMAWDGNDWQAVEGGRYAYAFDKAQRATDIYLPFELLGITDPAASSLSMVAFASDAGADGLRLWSTMPTGNNVNSGRVAKNVSNEPTSFILLKRYEWPSLAAGICPSGVQPVANSRTHQRTGDAVQFTGADIRAEITADPLGTGYSVLSDNLINFLNQLFANLTDWQTLQNELCQDYPTTPACERPPAQEGFVMFDFNPQQELASLMDVEHAPVSDGEQLTYQLRLTNRGSQPATGLKVEIITSGPIILPEGDLYQDELGESYILELEIGTLNGGEEETITFNGQIDSFFDANNNVGWASIDVILYDDTGSPYNNQLEWLFVDHEVDESPPDYLELSNAVNTLAVGDNTLNGFVSDASAVPTITLAVEQAGETTLTTCVDENIDEEEWTCQITIGEAQDGDEVKIRLRATDVHGQTSNWVDWRTLTIDSSPPSVTLDMDSQTALSDGYLGPNETILSGVITDNRLVSGVEVCEGERCEQLEVIIDDDTLSQTLYSYSDQPATPITIDAGAACEAGTAIERTFTVSDSFTIAYVDVGLNLSHSYRNDLNVDLYSPTGTQVRLMAFASTAENLDVLLGDAGSSLIQYDLTAHDIRAPYYEQERAPYEFLAAFNGEEAQGDWRLVICDNYPAEDDGSYHHARLRLTADRLQSNTAATFRYQLPLDENRDNHTQALTIYGLDSAGNRSTEPLNLSFTVDTTPPVVTANVPTQLSTMNLALTLNGQASDTSGIRRLQLSILDPTGQPIADMIEIGSTIEPAGTSSAQPNRQKATGLTNQLFLPFIASSSTSNPSTTWLYTDTRHFSQVGTYTLWIEAEDNAGNITQTEPYHLNVTAPSTLYLPLLSNYDPSQPTLPNAPDLGLGGNTVITDTLTSLPVGGNEGGETMIQLFNIGTVSTTQPFRLDLYFDPTDVPTTTITWDELSEYGGYWLVDEVIAPNEAITLTLDSMSDGNYPPTFDGLTHYYIQLDTLDQVSENHEVARTFNNNIVRGSWLGMEVEATEDE